MTDPAQIAKSLSDAQKRALLAMPVGNFWVTPKEIGCSANILWSMNPVGDVDPETLQIGPILVTWDYREKGIRDWKLTSEGLAVRAILEETP